MEIASEKTVKPRANPSPSIERRFQAFFLSHPCPVPRGERDKVTGQSLFSLQRETGDPLWRPETDNRSYTHVKPGGVKR